MSDPADLPARDVRLLINPCAGRGRGERCASPLREQLEDAGLRVTATVSRERGDIEADAVVMTAP